MKNLCAMVSILLVAAISTLAVAASDDSGPECQQQMQKWIDKQNELYPADREQDANKLLYFLHVPRTAGRTSHNCFLMPMIPPSRRCAKSYDGIKYNISVPDCGLLSSHDDYSAMYQFPSHAAVYTSIRNPVGRFLSAYEFAVEIASREAVKVLSRKAPSPAAGRVSTKNVWPWSYLAPFVEEDMIRRFGELEEDRRFGRWVKLEKNGETSYFNRMLNMTKTELNAEEQKYLLTEAMPPLDSYDNELYMPLLQYAQHDAAYELLHNGQTLQVLGLTNYSMDPDASELRACIRSDRRTGEMALAFAKERLRGMWHVGTYETLRPSLASLASLFGADVNARAYKSNTAHAFSYDGGEDPDAIKEDFLDESLPTTEEELKKALKELDKEMRSHTAAATRVKKARFATGSDEPSEEELELDAKVADGDARREQLNQQLTNLKAGTRVISRLEATGHARQLVSDEEHRLNKTVAENFASCEANAQRKARSKRAGLLARVKRADGATPNFSTAARKSLPKEVLRFIRDANWMDFELHALATELNAVAIDREAARGTLPTLPTAPPPGPPKQAARAAPTEKEKQEIMDKVQASKAADDVKAQAAAAAADGHTEL